jgi:hypothetical protein
MNSLGHVTFLTTRELSPFLKFASDTNEITPPSIYDIFTCMSGYRRGLDWWLNLLHTLIQSVTTLYSLLLHIRKSVHS